MEFMIHALFYKKCRQDKQLNAYGCKNSHPN